MPYNLTTCEVCGLTGEDCSCVPHEASTPVQTVLPIPAPTLPPCAVCYGACNYRAAREQTYAVCSACAREYYRRENGQASDGADAWPVELVIHARTRLFPGDGPCTCGAFDCRRIGTLPSHAARPIPEHVANLQALSFCSECLATIEAPAATCADCQSRMIALAVMRREQGKFNPTPTAVDRRYAKSLSTSVVSGLLNLSDTERKALSTYAGSSGGLATLNYCESCNKFSYGSARCTQCLCCNCEDKCDLCHKCSSCCRCPRCAECDVRQHTTCPVCSKCDDCCACPRCRNCGLSEPNGHCGDCERCPRCCRCGSVHEIYQTGENRDRAIKTFPDGTSRMAGIEIEYNDCRKFKPLSKWAAKWGAGNHTDGSCGWEAVTAPAAGEKLQEQVREFGVAMKEAGGKADSRCGVHVHVDARDLGMHAIRRLAKLYGHVEPILYILGGQHRLQNRYCAHNGTRLRLAAESKSWSHEILREVYKKPNKQSLIAHISHKQARKRDNQRYTGMNLCPWVAGKTHKRPDTTIEFRLHENCIDSDRLINWTKTLLALVDFAKRSEWNDVKDSPKSALRLLCQISPETAKWIVAGVRLWRKTYRRPQRFVALNRIATRSGKAVSVLGGWQIQPIVGGLAVAESIPF